MLGKGQQEEIIITEDTEEEEESEDAGPPLCDKCAEDSVVDLACPCLDTDMGTTDFTPSVCLRCLFGSCTESDSDSCICGDKAELVPHLPLPPLTSHTPAT